MTAIDSVRRLLLISNSTVYGCGYLDHVEQQIKSFLGSARKVLFFPFSLFDRDTYAAKAKARFAAMGYPIETAHAVPNPHNAIEQTDAIFIGGGNTFRLLKALQDLDLVEPVKHVELGQRDAVDTAGDHGLAHQHRVEPAAAPRPSGHRAELAAALAHLVPGKAVGQTVLAASGTKPAADLVHDFMGRSYSFQAYADWLNGK